MEDIKALLIVMLKNQAMILTKIEALEMVVNDNADIMDDPRFIEHLEQMTELNNKVVLSRLNEFLLEAKVIMSEPEKYRL